MPRVLAALLLLVLSPPGRADVVLDWNVLILNAIRLDNSGPTLSSRNLAILHCAIHDAVNSVVRAYQPYRFQRTATDPASVEAAAAAAAHEITRVLYPGIRGPNDTLLADFLATATPGPALTNGLTLGRETAQAALSARSADGSQTEVPYIPSNAAGQWRRTPPYFRPPTTPHWRFVTPFCLPALAPFLPPPPPSLDSPEYAAALNEVQLLGARTSSVRTAEQSEIARFWSDFSYTSMPPGHWHEIAAGIARQRGSSLVDNARLFALLSLAQADAAIVCWEAKYGHNLWRPITAIQRAGEDANPLTSEDPAWDSFLASPPFPAYPSGHSTFSQASARILTRFHGTDAITFTATSDTLPGVFRTFHSLAACADEIGLSRIHGGIHFPFDNVEGKRAGGRVGDFVSANFLLPNAELPLVRLEGFTDGAPQLRIHGHVGALVRLLASPDLEHWDEVASLEAEPGGVVVTEPAARMVPHRFYRAIE